MRQDKLVICTLSGDTLAWLETASSNRRNDAIVLLHRDLSLDSITLGTLQLGGQPLTTNLSMYGYDLTQLP